MVEKEYNSVPHLPIFKWSDLSDDISLSEHSLHSYAAVIFDFWRMLVPLTRFWFHFNISNCWLLWFHDSYSKQVQGSNRPVDQDLAVWSLHLCVSPVIHPPTPSHSDCYLLLQFLLMWMLYCRVGQRDRFREIESKNWKACWTLIFTFCWIVECFVSMSLLSFAASIISCSN